MDTRDNYFPAFPFYQNYLTPTNILHFLLQQAQKVKYDKFRLYIFSFS